MSIARSKVSRSDRGRTPAALGRAASGDARSTNVSVLAQPRAWRGITRAEVVARANAMLRILQLQDAQLSIVLIDDEGIRVLNQTWRQRDAVTDVLAFALGEGEHTAMAGGQLGDVVISVPTARRQARERDVAPLDELTFLLAHGLLHLLGHDHDTAQRERAMRKASERLCRAAGGASAVRAVRAAETDAIPSPKRPRL